MVCQRRVSWDIANRVPTHLESVILPIAVERQLVLNPLACATILLRQAHNEHCIERIDYGIADTASGGQKGTTLADRVILIHTHSIALWYSQYMTDIRVHIDAYRKRSMRARTGSDNVRFGQSRATHLECLDDGLLPWLVIVETNIALRRGAR